MPVTPATTSRTSRSGSPSEADPTPCWCLAVPLDTPTGQPPISDNELAIIEEIALLETERTHGNCGLPATQLAALATALAQPAYDAYVTARLNGLCEEGAIELFRDVLATALRTGLHPTA